MALAPRALNRKKTFRGLYAHLHAVVEAAHVLGNGLAANARVALHVHVVSQGQHHLEVKLS